MVEQTHTGESHDHAVVIAAVDDRLITNGAARLRNIFYTRAQRTLDIVIEREERIAGKRNAIDGVQIGPLFLRRKGCRPGGEILLPTTILRPG